MANRAVLIRPIAPDGSGDPGITRGVMAVYSAKKVKFADLGEWQPTAPLIITIAGTAVTKDFPVIEAADHNALIVKSYFGPTARYPDTPSSTEAVLVPAGAGTIDYEDLPRVDPSTLGPITTVPSAIELRIQALEAGGGPGSPVLSVAGKTGAVSLVVGDIGGITATGLSVATAASAAAARTAISAAGTVDTVLTGNPTAPTAAPGDSDTSIATTAFVANAVAGAAGGAGLVSPAFTGSPTAPTPTAGDNDTSIATTAFVTTAVGTLATTVAAKADTATVNAIKAPIVPIYCPGDVDQPRVNADGSALTTGQHAWFIKATIPTNMLVDDVWIPRDF